MKEMLHRADGIAAYVVMALFIVTAALGLVFDIRIGRLSGSALSLKLIAITPIVFLYYASLAYFSSSGKLSIAVNTLLVGLVPVLLFYYFA
jgi:hypothetical protein